MSRDDALQFITGIHKIDPEMPIQQVMCLLVIAKEEDGISLTDLSKKVGIGLATASRYVAGLGKINRHKTDGLGFVESEENPMERRKKIIRLTLKGEIALRSILGE